MVQEFSQVSRLHLQLLQRYRDNEILLTQQKTNIGYKRLPNTCNQLYTGWLIKTSPNLQ